jgi:fatty acid desaturase
MTYAELRQQVSAAGLLERSGWKLLPLALLTGGLGVLSVAILAFAPGAWRLLAAIPLEMFWIQVGFFGHDTGHNQVFERTEYNRRLGLLCFPLVLGMTFRPWVIKHNLHHAQTNILGEDPDIEHPVLAFSDEIAQSRTGLARWLVRYQAYAYPMLAFFTTLTFRVDAWRYASGNPAVPQKTDRYESERKLELALLFGNVLLWVALPSLLLGPLTWLPVFAIGQALLGFQMAFVFAPNHKGMPTYSDADASRLSFLELQVLTSRNVTGGPLVDFMYGGLNYQVEHHLFPTMPRTNLGKCHELVTAFCREIELPFSEEGVVGSCRILFETLDEIGRSVLLPRPVQPVELTIQH